MHYHELFSNADAPKLNPDFVVRTGYYSFYHNGSILTGNVFRVGETVSISTLTMGIVEINTLKFISDNPQKL